MQDGNIGTGVEAAHLDKARGIPNTDLRPAQRTDSYISKKREKRDFIPADIYGGQSKIVDSVSTVRLTSDVQFLM